MPDLDDILIFVKVAQFESITRAPRSLGMPISTLSRRLSVLESKLCVSLLRRTTGRITLTAQGREYFSQRQEPLNLLQEAEQVLTQGQKRPEGSLRITIPVVLSREPLFDFMSAFLKIMRRAGRKNAIPMQQLNFQDPYSCIAPLRVSEPVPLLRTRRYGAPRRRAQSRRGRGRGFGARGGCADEGVIVSPASESGARCVLALRCFLPCVE